MKPSPLEGIDVHAMLAANFGAISIMERRIVLRRMGQADDTLQRIRDYYNLSRERMQKMERDLFCRLRKAFPLDPARTVCGMTSREHRGEWCRKDAEHDGEHDSGKHKWSTAGETFIGTESREGTASKPGKK